MPADNECLNFPEIKALVEAYELVWKDWTEPQLSTDEQREAWTRNWFTTFIRTTGTPPLDVNELIEWSVMQQYRDLSLPLAAGEAQMLSDPYPAPPTGATAASLIHTDYSSQSDLHAIYGREWRVEKGVEGGLEETIRTGIGVDRIDGYVPDSGAGSYRVGVRWYESALTPADYIWSGWMSIV